MEIRKEVPIGVIDWVNKVFTLLNIPDFIDDLWIDWGIYINFTIDDKVITLQDAPVYNIAVDYKTWTDNTNTSTQITLWKIKSEIWRLLWQRGTSINFSPAIVTDEINNTLEDIWRWKVINKLSQKIIRAWKLWFQESYLNVKVQWTWIVTKEVNIWDTVIEANTVKLSESWSITLWWDVINYTWKTDTELVWVSWITTQHLEWDSVYQIYKLPADYDILLKVEEVINTTTWVDYCEIDSEWYTSYSLVRQGSEIYLTTSWMTQDTSLKISYVKQLFDLVDDDDLCALPWRYWIKVLAYICAWNLAYDKALLNGERLLNQWYTKLSEMYGFFNNDVKQIVKRIRPTSYKFNTMKRSWRRFQ